MCAIDIQQLQSRGLELFHDDLRETLHQCVPEFVLVFTFSPQTRAIQGDRPRECHRPRIKDPPVRRKEPRPPEHVSLAERLDDQRPSSRDKDFKTDRTMPEKIKLIGIVPFVKDELACLKPDVGGTVNDQLQVAWVQILEKWMYR
jgi:hypothetical protein